MGNKTNAILQDPGMERAILAGITTYGTSCFFEVEDILDIQDFYWTHNKELFKILSHLVHKEDVKTFDTPSIQAAAKILGYDNFTNGGKHLEYLEAIMDEVCSSQENVRSLVVAVYKLSLARRGYLVALTIQQNLQKITGAEDVDNIIGQIEEPIFEFTSQIMTQGVGIISLGKQFEHTMTTLSESPQDIVGLPTGFPAWDMAMGGGFRPATVNVVGARTKVGKCIDSFNTAILTSDGILMPYEMFHVKCEWGLYHHIKQQLLNEHGKLVQPEYGWVNGYKDVIKIYTKYGASLTMTPNHPIRVLDSTGEIIWKNAENLSPGDYTVCRRGDRCWGNIAVDLDDAYVFGLLVGDGCINDRIVDLASLDGICREQFTAFIERYNGDIGTIDDRHLRCNRVDVAKKISSFGFYDENKYKIFPKHIRMANEKVVCQALSGYFDADGCVEQHGVTVTTNSQKLAIQTKAMLLNLGILSKTRMRHIVPPGHTETRLYWETAIHNVESARMFRDLIGFRIKRKKQALDQFCHRMSSTKNDTVPNLNIPLKKLKIAIKNHRGYFLPGHRNDMRDVVNNWIRGTRMARRDIVQKLLNQLHEYSHLEEYKIIQTLIDKHLLFDRIMTLSEDKTWTSDFHIPDGHSFITNGIISHNSFLCMNIARNMAENNIPVLYLDTELTSELQLYRLTSLVSGVELNHVETGQFKYDIHESEALWGCQKHIEQLPIDHFSVAGLAPHSIISIARRWLSKTVGFTDSGAAKPCLIIYDYIKLMDDGGFKNNLQEYQLLGFLTTALHNFAVKFKLPVLATVQLNRDGVEKEGSEVVSGSDRIAWLCSNFTILKPKTQTELNEDPPSNGTKKLIVVDTRSGAGMERGEYINVLSNLNVGKLSEGQPFSMVTQSALENSSHEAV